MKQVAIASVVIIDRHRFDLGDLTALAESIRENGLLHPVVVTPDNRLVAGQRRLEACRLLGFEEVPATVVTNLTSAASLLRAERDENVCRKEMTPMERKSLTDALLELERPAARERMAEGGRKAAPGRPAERDGQQATPFSSAATDLAAEAAGWSRSSYRRATSVIEAATDPDVPDPVREVAMEAVADMEAGRSTIGGAAEKVAKAKIIHAKDEPTRRPAAERVEQIRSLTARGYRADQIAESIGVTEQQVRKLATEHGITLVDATLGKRRRVDPNRVVQATVDAASALVAGDELFDFNAVDPAQIPGWVSSLEESIRFLTTLKRNLNKELTQRG